MRLLFLIAAFFITVFKLSAQCSDSYATSSADSEIDEVVLAGESTTISNNTAGICATYSDFTAISPADLAIGSTYTITVTAGTCGGDYTKGGKVFIDWNRDGDFLDADEEAGSFGTNSLTQTYNVPITVPAGTTTGTNTMRIVVKETSDLSTIYSCGTYTYGETEDYNITVIPGLPKTLDSITVNQASSSDVFPGSTSQEILRIDFFVSGSTGTMPLNVIELTSGNTNDADMAASGVKLFYTTSPTFSTGIQLGAAKDFISGSASFTGLSQELATGANYVWVSFDVSATATPGNTMDAIISAGKIAVNGSTYPSSSQSPTGNRLIVLPPSGCQHSITLTDDYGDGWNGGSVSVYVNSVLQLSNLTISTGYGPEIHTFQAEEGDLIETTYTAGSYSYENEYTISNPYDVELLRDGTGGATPTGISTSGDCSSIATFTTNSNATMNGTNCIILTPDQTSQSGSAWYNYKVNLNASYEIQFDLYLGDDDGGADGVFFAFQGLCSNTGGTGGGIGFAGITPAIGVEFDTWYNGESWANDPISGSDHLAIMKNGIVDHSSASNLAGPNEVSNIEDNTWHPVTIKWTKTTNTLDVYFDGALALSHTEDIVANIFSGDSIVFWGFTAGTGAACNRHEVCITSFPTNTTQLSDTTICTGCSLQVSVSTGASSYSWSPNDGSISNPNIVNPVLTPSTSTTYSVEIEDACGNIVRDQISVTVEDPLPLKLLEFKSICRSQSLELEWTSAVENGTEKYLIDVSQDGYGWSNIGSLKAFNNSDSPVKYSFLTENNNIRSYYRLRQKSLAGITEISDPLECDCKAGADLIEIYPNPAREMITIKGVSSSDMITIRNSQGQIEKSVSVSENMSISTEDLAAGFYMIEIISSEYNRIESRRLIIRP